MRAQIINASWSLPGGLDGQDVVAISRMVESASDHILFVAAAGNSKLNHDIPGQERYPASLPLKNVISVAATTIDDGLQVDSDKGKETVHIGAPGEFIFSTIPPNRIKPKSQTSMAAPFVSGCAAFVQAQRLKVGLAPLNPEDLKNVITGSADQPLPNLSEINKGRRLNCHRAYQVALSQ